MGKENGISIVVGSGEKGLKWANRKGKCFAFDHEFLNIDDLYPNNFIQGDSLCLPFRDNSIKFIYSDFLLNAIQAGDTLPKDVEKNPDVLASNLYPKNIREWYKSEIKGKFHIYPHFGQIRWMLRETALAEMWRVVAVDGEINIVDHNKVISWIINNHRMLFSNKRYETHITSTKHFQWENERSSSFTKVLEQGAKPRKLKIQKRD